MNKPHPFTLEVLKEGLSQLKAKPDAPIDPVTAAAFDAESLRYLRRRRESLDGRRLSDVAKEFWLHSHPISLAISETGTIIHTP